MSELNLKFCAHCNSHLSLKTWRAHRRLYYNDDTETWIKKVCTEEEFNDWDEDIHLSSVFEATSQGSMDGSDCEVPPLVDFNVHEDIFYDALSEQPPIGELSGSSY